jgi:hypothetical protein
MSVEAVYTRMQRLGDMLKLIGVLSAAFSVTLSLGLGFATVLWRAYDGRELLRDLLGITELHLMVQNEDGIISVQPPRSYAITPVSKRDPIVHATYYARRTERGVPCTAEKVVFIFSGSKNNPKPGELLTEIMQVGRDWGVLEVDVKVPDVISTGPVIMAAQVTYTCPWGTETDDLPPLQFILTD